jgi:hypothetical protein
MKEQDLSRGLRLRKCNERKHRTTIAKLAVALMKYVNREEKHEWYTEDVRRQIVDEARYR